MYLLVTELLSGLALFLFGMKYMSDSLQQAAGGKLRGILDRCTKNSCSMRSIIYSIYTVIRSHNGYGSGIR